MTTLVATPLPELVSDWAGLLDQFDAREILHVTFGSVLTAKTAGERRYLYARVVTALDEHAEAYAANLERHFIKHLRPFMGMESL